MNPHTSPFFRFRLPINASLVSLSSVLSCQHTLVHGWIIYRSWSSFRRENGVSSGRSNEVSDVSEEKKIGEFFTTKGFFYRGELLGESPTHWCILDLKTGLTIELSKATVDRVVWKTGGVGSG